MIPIVCYAKYGHIVSKERPMHAKLWSRRICVLLYYFMAIMIQTFSLTCLHNAYLNVCSGK